MKTRIKIKEYLNGRKVYIPQYYDLLPSHYLLLLIPFLGWIGFIWRFKTRWVSFGEYTLQTFNEYEFNNLEDAKKQILKERKDFFSTEYKTTYIKYP